MAWVDDHIVGEREDARERLTHCVSVAAWKVKAPDRASKEEVTDEKLPVVGVIERDVAGGMAGRMEGHERDAAYRKELFVDDGEVRWRRRFDVHAEHEGGGNRLR